MWLSILFLIALIIITIYRRIKHIEFNTNDEFSSSSSFYNQTESNINQNQVNELISSKFNENLNTDILDNWI